jgi:MFS family permease
MTYEQGLQSNIWKYGVALITHRRIYWPLLTVYFLTFPDTSVRQIGYFMAIGQIAGFLMEVPSGYLSDKIGHKRVLVLARVFLILSTIFYLIGGSFWVFALGSTFFALDLAFTSGAKSAFFHDVFKAMGREKDHARVLGRVRSTTWIVSAVMLVVIPYLAKIDIRIPFIVALVLDVVGLLVTLSLVNPKVEESEATEIKSSNFRSVLKEAVNYKFFPVLLHTELFMGVMIGLGTLRDVYQVALGIPIFYLGALLAASRLVASLASRYSHLANDYLDSNRYFFLELLIFFPMLLVLGLSQNTWVIVGAFALSIGLLWGLVGNASGHYKLMYIKDSKFKATLLSLGGLLQFIFVAGTGLLLAMLVQDFSYRTGYLYYALISFALLSFTYVLLLRYGPATIEPERNFKSEQV